MPAVPDLILGLDGGGTKTLLALADRDGAVRHVARSASLDPFADAGWPAKLESVAADIAWCRPRLAGVVLGLPCHGEAADVSARQVAESRRLFPAPLAVVNDVEAAFDGALVGAAGVLILAGTGSMAWAGDGRRTIRCGGWGDVFGDEGSAYWIGREALGKASRASDGRSGGTAFAELLLDRLGLRPDELVGWCYGLRARRTAIAALAHHVDALAEAGEPEARALLARAGDALALHAEACVQRLTLPASPPWSYAGSVFESRTVMRRVTERLGIAQKPPRLPPLGGALLRAARLAGWPVDDNWIERLGRALAEAAPSARLQEEEAVQ